jgi:hypothetical protein
MCNLYKCNEVPEHLEWGSEFKDLLKTNNSFLELNAAWILSISRSLDYQSFLITHPTSPLNYHG